MTDRIQRVVRRGHLSLPHVIPPAVEVVVCLLDGVIDLGIGDLVPGAFVARKETAGHRLYARIAIQAADTGPEADIYLADKGDRPHHIQGQRIDGKGDTRLFSQFTRRALCQRFAILQEAPGNGPLASLRFQIALNPEQPLFAGDKGRYHHHRMIMSRTLAARAKMMVAQLTRHPVHQQRARALRAKIQFGHSLSPASSVAIQSVAIQSMAIQSAATQQPAKITLCLGESIDAMLRYCFLMRIHN